MHQNNGTIFYVIHDFLNRRFHILRFPVQSVNGPQNHRGSHSWFYRIINRSIWRADHRSSLTCKIYKLFIHSCNFWTDLIRRKSRQILMVISVVSKFTAQFFHAFYFVRKTGNLSTHHKESCLCIIFFQTVQKTVCKRTGTIIKSKGDRLLCRRGTGLVRGVWLTWRFLLRGFFLWCIIFQRTICIQFISFLIYYHSPCLQNAIHIKIIPLLSDICPACLHNTSLIHIVLFPICICEPSCVWLIIYQKHPVTSTGSPAALWCLRRDISA